MTVLHLKVGYVYRSKIFYRKFFNEAMSTYFVCGFEVKYVFLENRIFEIVVGRDTNTCSSGSGKILLGEF